MVFNYLLVGFGIYIGLFIVVVILIPNSLKTPIQEKESSKPWINEKISRRRINLSHSFLKFKDFLKRDKILKKL